MRIAVTGTSGRVGRALVNRLGVNHEVIELPRGVLDLAERGSLVRALDQFDCEVLVNPAGVTGLEACEDDPVMARRVNGEAVGELASWAAARGVRLIHFSTDYVLGGRHSGLQDEEVVPEPLSVYGSSKHAGEQWVLEHAGHLVIRVSWVFGAEKPSFIDSVFDSALANKPISAVADKYSLPTFTRDLGEWVEKLIELGGTGLVHACNSGVPVSWHGMATVVVREMVACGVIDHLPEIEACKLDEVPWFRAVRPRHTAMATPRLAKLLGESPRPWQQAVAEYVRWLSHTRCGRRC